MSTADPRLGFWSNDEIQDYVLHPDDSLVYRQQNEAANNELRRRGWGGQVPSGDVAPYAIEWISTGGDSWVEEPEGVSMRTFAIQTTAASPTPAATSGSMVLSQPTHADLVIYRGDSGRFRVTVTDPANAPVDVSSATWECEIRVAPDDTTVMATFDIMPVGGDVSSVDVILTPAQSAGLTESGVWDLQMTMGGEVQTLMAGKVTLTKDVSRP